MEQVSLITIGSLLFAGAAGAFVKDVLSDGKIKLPTIKNGELILGFLGVIIIGAAVGYLVDHSPITAFCAGFTGFSAVTSLLPKKSENKEEDKPNTEV